MSTTLYIVRHAEVDNPKGIEYMRLPGFGLSNFGIKQAQKLADILHAKGIDRIYSSPLERTKETAKILSKGTVPVRYSPALIETNFKKWQGIKRDCRPKNEVEGYEKNPVKYSAILGESLVDIQKRVMDQIFKIIEKHQGERIVIVTHAAPAVIARLFFEDKSLMEFSKTWVNFASVTTITLDDKLNCKGVRYNEYVDQRKVRDE